jgi:hypothetical protein
MIEPMLRRPPPSPASRERESSTFREPSMPRRNCSLSREAGEGRGGGSSPSASIGACYEGDHSENDMQRFFALLDSEPFRLCEARR